MVKTTTLTLFLLYAGIACSQADSSIYSQDTTALLMNAAPFSTSGSDAESHLDLQDVSSLLQSSGDVYIQFSGFQFGAAQYRMRGYAPENQQVMINGINLNNPETGYSSWSSWGGLNDVVRYPELRFGTVANRYGFAAAGGYIQIDSKAAAFKKGTRIGYSSANRLFRHRLMLTHATGLMRNGWAFTLSASTRQGSQVYIPGTFYSASAFYLSLEKHLSNRHQLSFTGFVSPVQQGRASAEPLEAYQLTGNQYYNALWGYQDGKMRNSEVSKTERPVLMLNHVYKPDASTQLSCGISYSFGKSGITGLNWNNAAQPHPDYYMYLPSYFYNKGNTAAGDLLTQQWQSDIATRQINWDRLIALNQGNLYTPPAQLGQSINTNETRARYILENKMESMNNLVLNTVYQKKLNNLFISAGVNATLYKNRKYKMADDLLGASYWLDYDQFAQNLGVDPSYQQNNIEQPDIKIRQGDMFGYNYALHIYKTELWGQAEYSFRRVDVYAAGSMSGSRIWREGLMANGKFPNTSKGNSTRLNFLNAGIKAGLTYKISGRQFITLNGQCMNRPPEANYLFLSQTTRNDVVNGIRNEQLWSGDINYMAKYPTLKVRLTYYYTQINNQLWLRRYWSDLYNNTVNYFMTGVNENHQGLELGLEKILFTSHTLQAALGCGRYIYTARPTAQAWQDNNNVQLFTNRTVYLKNYHVGGSPQFAAGAGYKYTAKAHWFAAIYFNYTGGLYVEANPDRRTAEAVARYLDSEPEQVKQVIAQQRLPDYYYLNLSAGKSFRIRHRYAMNVQLSVNNLLNNRHILVSGVEQLRWDPDDVNRFANKYTYMTGITYMLMVNLNF